ncbi:hypothetical protein [Erythrobacter sp. SG61-1L]|uniref:hypothetical protein n=1 Tax=Erythrobacter sp. SG61-1L TaxID=1603897 RepID=UPI000A88202B|nr:hypothetical protein [Erythrobacter sp. SG61-1L]
MDKPAPQLRFAWKPMLVQSQIVGILVLAQFQLHMWSDMKPAPTTPDKAILYFLLFAGLNFTVMFAGDRLARKVGWWTRGVYMGLGATAASVAHAVALAPAAYVLAFREGTLFALLLVPILIGAATAFLMHKSLGYAAEGDDPHALFQKVNGATDSGAVYDIGSAEYYDGPLQIRTSATAALIAAFTGSALYVFITLISLTDGVLPAGALPPLFTQSPILAALFGICGTAAPFYVFIRRSHAFLQKRGKDSLKSYALAGIFVPLGFALALLALMGPFGIILVLPWILPSVAAMATYHRLAGFEPLDLPGDIEVRDPRAMLPADHIRRRVRRVVRAD